MPERSFAEVLGEIEGGKLATELSAKLAELTRAVVDTRKPGSLKLTLKLTPTGKATVVIAHKLDTSVPNDRLATTFFVDKDGRTLVRDDPDQERLPLREVPEGDRRLRAVKD